MMKIYQKVAKVTQQELEAAYELKEPIDSGSYGLVMKYQDRKTRDFVAIKFLKDQDGLQGFEKESQIMNQIDHINVLKCLGFFYNTTKSQFLLITPYCDKINLKNCLPEIAQFDQKQKIWLCVQIARGINALHSKNIMHRDIKPANILITGNWVVKLCDFGFGKIDDDYKQSIKVGTPLYRDPNVNLGKYSKKCDIYSVGLVYDTIFRGQSYFARTPQNIFNQELVYFKQNKKKIINKLNCSQEMKDIIIGCLETDETKRLSSKALLAKLEEIWARLSPESVEVNGAAEDRGFEEIVRKERNQANQRKFNNLIQARDEKKDEKEAEVNPMKQSMYLPDAKALKRLQTEPHPQNSIQSHFLQSESQNLYATQIQPQPQFQKKSTKNESPIKSLSSSSINLAHSPGTKLLAKLLRTSEVLADCAEKTSNFQTVYRFFVERKKKIRGIVEIEKVQSIPARDKKIVVFVALFAYLRFLKLHKHFLKNQTPQIPSIQGLPLTSLSKKTISLSLDLVESQLLETLTKIRPFLADLHSDRNFYRERVTPGIGSMIDEGVEKKFMEIEKFQAGELVREFQGLVRNKRYGEAGGEDGKVKDRLCGIVGGDLI